MRLTLLLCLLPFAALAQSGPDQTSGRIASLQTGVICPPPIVGTRPAPDTVAGTTHVIEGEPPFVSLMNRVPAVIGIGFGARAMAEDLFGIDNVTMVVEHPPMGPEGATRQSFLTSISGTDTSLTFYQFDYDYELLIGTWQMQAVKDGKTLFRTAFEVVPPKDLPQLATLCGYEELLS